MEPNYKKEPIRPLFYPSLITSTPDSHKISKRIKGLSAYSEHYKGIRIDYPNVGPSFSPLRTRDYRKSRELTLEIWDPMIQASFLEKFLKSQKNLQIIRMKIFTKKEYNGEILNILCGILCKNSGLSRVHIDFCKEQRKQAMPGLIERVRSLRKLPKLKDLEVTVAGEQVLPVSVSLGKVGFDGENGSFKVEDSQVIQKLMKKTSKFHHLDTIKTDSRTFFAASDRFLDALILVISKLPNLRELDLSDSKDLYLPMEKILNILDTLVKAPELEIFRMGVQIKDRAHISLLEHPIFKAKSLKRLTLSLFSYKDIAPGDLEEILDLLGGMPSLYGLYLDFFHYTGMSDEALMKKMSGMTSLRKLKIHFAESIGDFRAKQVGNIVRWIFNEMVLLEELDLKLPKSGLDLGENNEIQGLPRLKKASFHMEKWKCEKESEIRGVVEILGKCCRLRELELVLTDSVRDCEKMTLKLRESLSKLKELQVFRLYAIAQWRNSNMTKELMREFLMTWNGLRNLQDLTVFMGKNTYERILNNGDLYNQLTTNKKYRFLVIGF